MNIKYYLPAIVGLALAPAAWAYPVEPEYTSPFQTDGSTVFASIPGNYSDAYFQDSHNADTVRVGGFGKISLDDADDGNLIQVGDGSSISISSDATLSDEDRSVVVIEGAGTINNAGAIYNDDRHAAVQVGGYEDSTGSTVTNSGSIESDESDAIDLTSENSGGTAVNKLTNSGEIFGNDRAIYFHASDADSNTLTNSGIVEGDRDAIDFEGNDSNTNTFHNSNSGIIVSGGGYGVHLEGNDSGTNTFTNAGYIISFGDEDNNNHNDRFGPNGEDAVYFQGQGASVNSLTNTGLIAGEESDGIYFRGSNGTNTITLDGGGVYGDDHAIYIAEGTSDVAVDIVGRSEIEGDIDNRGSTGTIHLDLVGVTSAVAAQLAADQGDDYGDLEVGDQSYDWRNLTMSGTAVVLEQVVDPGLRSAARAIDNQNQDLALGFDGFYSAAAVNPEAALNELTGREIDNAIDVNEVNQATTLAYELQNHLDSASHGVGGFDMSDFHVSTASQFAFMDTDAQLSSLLHGSQFGGTDMSTDNKDMKDTKQTDEVAAAPRWGAWASGTVTIADQSPGSIPGYQATTGSPTLGLDYRLNSHWTVGALINYSTTGANFGDGSRLGVQTGLGGFYGVYHQDKWHVNAFAAGGYSTYDIDRTTFGATASSHPNGEQVVSDATGGYDVHLTHDLMLTPELGVTYTHVGVNNYTEETAGALDLSKGEQDIDSLRSHLGARLSDEFTWRGVTFIPEVRASYYHEFMDDSRGVTTSLPGAAALGAFPVSTQNPERDFALAGVGLNTVFTGAGLPMGAFLNYDVQVGQSDYTAQNIDAGFRVGF